MADSQIIDSHAHLWEPRERDWYPVLHGYAERFGRPVLLDRHLLADYLANQPSATVAGLVHVSATTNGHTYLDEARWVEEELGTAPVASATIGTVDPALPAADLVAHLDRQAESPRFRGVRVYRGLEPGSAAAGVILSWLDGRGLVFDLAAAAASLPEWARTLEAFPDLTVVLEHLGSPGDASPDGMARWAAAMREAARSTTWTCKFSGLGMLLPEITAQSVRPWLESAADAWGWERLMFGSNMPMDALAVDHEGLLGAVRAPVAALADADEARRFFYENARRAYDLPLPAL